MKHFARLMLLTLGLGVVVVVVSSFPRPAAAAPSDKTVTIDPTQLPLPVTSAGQPFQTSLCAGLGVCPPSVPSIYTVPSDRRLVIQFVSGNCVTAGPPNRLRVGIGAFFGGTGADFPFPLSADPFGSGEINLAQQTLIYADPGSVVLLEVGTGGYSGASAVCTVSLSGYTTTP